MTDVITDRIAGVTAALAFKAPCVAIATTPITLAGLQTIGDVVVDEDDRVIVDGQADTTENGIYNASTGAWQRALDFDGARDAVPGTLVSVYGGVNQSDLYEVQATSPLVIGTSALTFALRYGSNTRYDRTLAEIAASVTPTNYNRKPGDFIRYGLATDASPTVNAAAINAALSCNARCFCEDSGTYQVNTALLVQSNQTIDLAQGVTIQGAASIAWAGAGIFSILSKTNVTMRGGVVDGNKANNATGQVFGVKIYDSSKIRLEGVSANNCPGSAPSGVNGGDGFYIGGALSAGSTDVSLIDCVGDANVRQGLSIVRGERIRVIAGGYINTTGSAPGAGIDLEGNDPSHILRDIVIDGVNLSGNYYGLYLTTAGNGITVKGCPVRGNRASAMFVGDCDNAAITGNTIISGITVDGSAIVDMSSATSVVFADNIVVGNASAEERNGIRVQIGDHIKITGNIVRNTGTAGISIGLSSQSADFSDVTVRDNTLIDCVASGTAASIGVTGNTGSGKYPLLVTIIDNQIIDTRSGGNEADVAISVATGIPAATQAGYRIERNRVSGPALTYLAGTMPPLCGQVTWNPGSLVDGAGETSPSITVTGAALGDFVEVHPPYDMQGFVFSGYVQAANTAVIRIQNESGSTVDLASSTWKVRVRKLTEL